MEVKEPPGCSRWSGESWGKQITMMMRVIMVLDDDERVPFIIMSVFRERGERPLRGSSSLAAAPSADGSVGFQLAVLQRD
ncbi:hypothetical protein EYF80_023831 [Liparis tanakae]|uniref:Uncharacterized protein n=1 Tax=Liparis tanakae TaxID=230148 RepID=A0A4Z2HJH0_9TELE|nr:hypothetical protein EYF80_023831 [Liparis tanakae]